MNFPPEFHLLSIEVQRQIVDAQVKISGDHVKSKQAELLVAFRNDESKLKELLSCLSSGVLIDNNFFIYILLRLTNKNF